MVAVKALAHLAGQIGEREAESASLGLELEFHLQLALLETVLDIAGACVLGDFALEAIDGQQELVEVGRGELDLDGIANGKQRGRINDGFGAGHLADPLAQPRLDLSAVELALLRRLQFDGNFGEVPLAAGTRGSRKGGTPGHRLVADIGKNIAVD